MKIGLLIIASEILEGKITDLNGKILINFLNQYHLELSELKVIRDQIDEIKNSIEHFYHKFDLTIISGGLGPTDDDLTKLGLSLFLNKKIVFSDEALKVADTNYTRLKRTYPGKDHPYSFVPEGVAPLDNPTGFAPGLMFTEPDLKKVILCAQGVPREFATTLKSHLPVWIQSHLKQNEFFENLTFRTKLIPEEKIFNEVDPLLWNNLAQYGVVSSLPILMGVDIGVKIKASSREELAHMKASVISLVKKSPVAQYIWANELISLEEKIISLANQKQITFSFAESCSGGLCSQRVTNIPGSSQSFVGSVVCYHESVKENILGVSKESIKNFGVVSSEVAKEMAQGVASKLGTHIGISLTGLAGPGGGSELLPVGTVHMGVYQSDQVSSEAFVFQGDRTLLKERFSQIALYKLLEILEASP